MKNTLLFSLLTFLISICTSVFSYAEERYVADTLFVPLRNGMGNQYRILDRGIPSGTRLILLEEQVDEANENWTKVETPKGEQGWIRSQYLVDEPIAKIKLIGAEKKISALNTAKSELKKKVERLNSENKSLQKQAKELSSSTKSLSSELENIKEVSGNAINLHQQHQKLQKAYQLLQTDADVLKSENQRLEADQRYHEWLFGSGILGAGIIITLIAQAMGGRRKQSSEWG